MFRSPISPASFCTSARSSSRNATSSDESGATFEIFLPGILIPNHQSNAKIAATAMAMRSALKKIRLNTSPPSLSPALINNSCSRDFRGAHAARVLVAVSRRNNLFSKHNMRPVRGGLRDLPPEAQRAENEKQVRHQ